MRGNSRIRRLASHLPVIRILLNPPSPPSSGPDSPSDIPISSNCNRKGTGMSIGSVASPPYLSVPPNQTGPSMNVGCFLQVPQRPDMLPEDIRLFSPPPRRCSNVSAYSEEYSTTGSIISDSNLLSPAIYPNSTRSNSFASASYSDDNETPPNEYLNVTFLRPRSTQVTKGQTELEICDRTIHACRNMPGY